MKIPKEAKRVFKGIIFDVYHWEQEMFDGSRQTFERLKRPDTVNMLAVKDGKIILGQEEQPSTPPFIGILAAKTDEGETPLEAAKRELLEEAGMSSDDWKLIYSHEPSTKIDWTSYLFIARNCRRVQQPSLEAGEKIELKEVNFEEFLEIIQKENFRNKDMAHYICKQQLKQDKLESFKKDLKL